MLILSFDVWNVYHRIRLKINRYGNWTQKGKPFLLLNRMIQIRGSINSLCIRAYQYAEVNWKDYLRQASSRRLLDYSKEVIARLGHLPTCKHEDPCDIFCEADRTVRCIEVLQQ